MANNYIQNAVRTENADYEKIKHRIATRRMVRLLHGVMGVTTEAGELMDSLKRTIIYGKELDVSNLKEELGDLLWYVAILCSELNLTLEDVQDANIRKLLARYQEGYSDSSALVRDTARENAAIRSIYVDNQSDSVKD